MNNDSWINHPNLKNIDPRKLKMIAELSNQTNNKSQNELIPFFLAMANKSKQEGLSFSPQEMNVIVNVIKSGKSKEEVQKMDKVLNMMKFMK